MVSANKKRQFVVGISYDSPDEDKGHYVMKRNTTSAELKSEVADILQNGCEHPQFPPTAHPVIRYAFYLENDEEIDCMDCI